MPKPTEISQNGWYLLAVFMSIIVACAIGATSVGLAAFIGIFVLTFTHIISVQTALFSAFLAILISIGVPPIISIILLTNMSALSSGLTHYAVAHGSVFFSTGYVEQKKWWKVGFIVSIAHIVIWYGVGMLWWKLMGLY